MKINSIGIQNYQQLNRTDNNRSDASRRGTEADSADSVLIQPQSSQSGSSMAVKAPSGTFADSLSPQERQALDLLFARFKETGRFSAGARGEAEQSGELGVGNIIDVKV